MLAPVFKRLSGVEWGFTSGCHAVTSPCTIIPLTSAPKSLSSSILARVTTLNYEVREQLELMEEETYGTRLHHRTRRQATTAAGEGKNPAQGFELDPPLNFDMY
jgi:hypothetical protein